MTITEAIQSAGLGTWPNYINNNWASTTALPANFPLGWNNYYIMKYEISQEQYGAFLNSLTYEQQANRMLASPNAAVGTLALTTAGSMNRNGLRIMVPGVSNNTAAVVGCDLNGNGLFNETADGQNIACNYLSWGDLAAYLDWSALRPMTEFEFEKACRGIDTPITVPDYAWGPNFLAQASSASLSANGEPAEASTTTGAGLCAYGESGAINGPLRCGFAAGATTTRLQAGAGWYGVMDLSGNVMEQCIGGRNFNYSGFTAANGDGSLHWSGLATTSGWPTLGGGLNGGAIARGGAWNTPSLQLAVSDRYHILENVNQGRNAGVGGRGVRSF
jgi:formylglycine-generating enzyme required for sulfatase activity